MSLLQLSLNGGKITLILGGFDILIEKSKNKAEANKLFDEKNLKVYRNILFGIENSGRALSELEKNLNRITIEPLCIVSISDQVRDDVMEAINLFHKNDIEIKILSGDNALAVQAVAKEIGWNIKDEELVSGNEIDEINDEEFFNTVQKKKIFARLKPEHKLKIIKALRKEKIYTAMIGDGVNDLPAIKESDMGIAMEEGSQITKEVADIVLLKNKFALLPDIFDEGNKIVNTVASVAKLFLTKNFMVIYFTLLSMTLLFDFPLTPRRVTLINIFSITLPAVIIALKNNNVSKLRNFAKELFSFVIISSGIIVAAAYTGQLIIEKLPRVSGEDIQMAMLSIMVIITASNFLAVTVHKDEKNIKLYLIYALGLVLLYSFLAVTNISFVIIKWIKLFYEISYLRSEYWVIVALISLISSITLFSIQKLRQKYFTAD
jgi:cation-transporting ATPase E